MSSWRARFLIAAVALVLGFMLVPQFRSQRSTDLANQSLSDQFTYIGSLYRSNIDLRDQIAELQDEVARYARGNEGSSNLESLATELQRLRIANGEVDIIGPGVRVTLSGGPVDARHLQDAVNE